MAVREFAARNHGSNKLVLKEEIYSVDKTWTERKPDVTFKEEETEQFKTAHKTVLSQASPFFTALFKEQWKQDKPSDEYPLPGDIDWEVFTTIISILYGKEVEFEEKDLPDLFRAADYLQLDTLKVAIVVSLTEEWEVKNSEVVGAMLTAAVSQSDRRVHGGWLASVSKRYLVRNIHTVVNTPTADISALPYDTVKEIAQTEEVTAPELKLYHFLRVWADANKKALTVQQMEDLFSHVRYATIPHDDLTTITKYSTNYNPNLSSVISTEFNPNEEVDTKQFTTRKHQQPVLLLNSKRQKKWTKRVCLEETKYCTDYSCYSIVSGKASGGLVVSLPTVVTVSPQKTSGLIISCSISDLPHTDTRVCQLRVAYINKKKLDEDLRYSKYHVTPSIGGVTIYTTDTGLEMKALDSSTVVPAPFDCPHPWLLTIQCPTPFTVQAM